MRTRWHLLTLAGLLVGLMGCSGQQGRHSEQLSSQSTEERLQAVQALETSDSGDSIDLLKQALLDPDAAVRLAAVEALGKRSEPEARTALLEVLKGEHWRRAALEQYEKAAQLGGDEAGIRIAMGRLYKDLGNNDKALEQVESAEILAQDNVYELMSVQFLYNDLGETEKAAALQERIQELQPAGMPGGMINVPATPQ